MRLEEIEGITPERVAYIREACQMLRAQRVTLILIENKLDKDIKKLYNKNINGGTRNE